MGLLSGKKLAEAGANVVLCDVNKELLETEAAAIRAVLGDRVPVSSLKGHLGHTLGASGSLELAAVYGMMRDGIVLPTRNLETVDDCAGILLPREIREQPVRVCLKNSIAFGGVNVSLVCRKMD